MIVARNTMYITALHRVLKCWLKLQTTSTAEWVYFFKFIIGKISSYLSQKYVCIYINIVLVSFLWYLLCHYLVFTVIDLIFFLTFSLASNWEFRNYWKIGISQDFLKCQNISDIVVNKNVKPKSVKKYTSYWSTMAYIIFNE